MITIGEILRALQASALADQAVVVDWGDNGSAAAGSLAYASPGRPGL